MKILYNDKTEKYYDKITIVCIENVLYFILYLKNAYVYLTNVP